MKAHRVTPFSIRPGDTIATKFVEKADGTLIAIKTRSVKHVDMCNKPECIHIDGACYDNRFGSLVKVG